MPGVFVTGGTGFIGGAVLDRLATEPDTGPVKALARDRTGGETVNGLGAEPMMGDILEPDTLVAGMQGCDIVYHVAGLNAMCLRDPSPLIQVNVQGSLNVIKAAAKAGVTRVVHTSSAATLGEEKGTVGTEDTVHRGNFLSEYEFSKYRAEQEVTAAADAFDVELVIVNPSSVQGPGRTTGTARLLLDFLNRGTVAAWDTTVSIVDIADCADGHVRAGRSGVAGRRYVLNGASIPLREAADLLAKITGHRPRLVYLPAGVAVVGGAIAERIAQVMRRDPPICREMVRVLRHGHSYDGSRAERELGVNYAPIQHTFFRTVAWYVEYGFVQRALPNFSKG